MHAVIRTGGKQYIVKPGDIIDIEKISGENGETINFDEVLLVSNDGEVKVGKPLVENVKVEGKILKQKKGDKIIVFKFKRRKKYRKKAGHRQKLTSVEITNISV
ncbi:MAG: 50S ribosomal protein L21 [Candidatus Dadabacteria bacterium]|nr:50S ribosomal protein L21 [Candidatus Dadabacteria bacterium]NIQ16916.1 50S ribosomal protein L21 [Candidatus Dadabacteria bacterium]